MKCVMVMFDSLNRSMLPCYGCDWTHAPNFQRLTNRAATFDNSYVCSMPCMPARRDLHTCRPNFLHRSWGPLEPFDDSVPEMLQRAGVHTTLISDHQHYWEDGGCTYHSRYSTWQFNRGQEGDPWIGQVAPEAVPADAYQQVEASSRARNQDRINRKHICGEDDFPQAKTFAAGLDFIERNRDENNWFLQIETFDPHEPFFSPDRFKGLYPEHYETYRGPQFDWPPYRPMLEDEHGALAEHVRHEYASLLGMCDDRLGRVLDMFDRYDMWDDTMLVVWTDHGFLLGEHECWAKCWAPFYNEVAHTPFFVWDPRCAKQGVRRRALVQPAIDLGPTLLGLFGVEPTPDMLGKDLGQTIDLDTPVRDAAIFGIAGGQVNVTDGRHVYMRATESDSPERYEYTLMPTHMRGRFSPGELAGKTELAGPFGFTKGCHVLKIHCDDPAPPKPTGDARMDAIRNRIGETMLFDLESDPGQQSPISDPEVEAKMIGHLTGLMHQAEAPPEQFERLGLNTQPAD
jgi:arylsulfatase A-like enzyme